MTALKSGRSDIECSVCGWALPGETHYGQGTRERPINADYADAAMPLVSAHLCSTGHPVRVISTTYSGDLVERTSQLISPRATPKENR